MCTLGNAERTFHDFCAYNLLLYWTSQNNFGNLEKTSICALREIKWENNGVTDILFFDSINGYLCSLNVEVSTRMIPMKKISLYGNGTSEKNMDVIEGDFEKILKESKRKIAGWGVKYPESGETIYDFPLEEQLEGNVRIAKLFGVCVQKGYKETLEEKLETTRLPKPHIIFYYTTNNNNISFEMQVSKHFPTKKTMKKFNISKVL